MISFLKRKVARRVESTSEQSSAQSEDEKDEGSLAADTRLGHSVTDSVGVLDYSVSGDSSLSCSSRRTAFQIMADTLFHYADGQRLFSDNPMVWNGVALRLSKGQYVCAPQHDPRLQVCMQALKTLNVPVSSFCLELEDLALQEPLTLTHSASCITGRSHCHLDCCGGHCCKPDAGCIRDCHHTRGPNPGSRVHG